MDKQQREAQKPVNREEARMLVASVGYEEASAKTGIKPATLRKWSERYQWKVLPTHSLAVTNVTKPSDALATVLEERKGKTKLHLSKYVEEASEEAANYNSKLKITGEAKDLASVASQLWPEKEQQGSGVMGGLRVYSQQTVLNVQVNETPTPQTP